MSLLAKILSLSFDDAIATKSSALKTYYRSLRLIKDTGTVNPGLDSKYTTVLLNGKCIDAETRCLYVFYIDTYYNSAWIIEVNLDNRVITVVYYDKDNNIGFDPLYKIYNARVVYGRLVWTDNKNPIYQMDIERAKKSFYYKIGYGQYPNTAEWNPLISYGIDQIVSDGNYFYKSVSVGNIGNVPKDDDGTLWTKLCLIEDAYYSMNVENFYFEPVPPKLAPTIEYITDDTRRINSLRQTLFQVAYRYVYMDWRKSTFSPASITPIPQNEEETATGLANENVSLNNGLKITVNTGGEEVRAVEIVGRSSNDPSSWYLIETINKLDEQEGVGETSIIIDVLKVIMAIIVPAPTTSNSDIVMPAKIGLSISCPLIPGVINSYISADNVYKMWTALQFGIGEAIHVTITIVGGVTGTIHSIPSWITIEKGGVILDAEDIINNGDVLDIYPTAENIGGVKIDYIILHELSNVCNIEVEQAMSLVPPSTIVSIEVDPLDTSGMTLWAKSVELTYGSIGYDFLIIFTPDNPLYGDESVFIMGYRIFFNGIQVNIVSYPVTNRISNSILLSVAEFISPYDNINVLLRQE